MLENSIKIDKDDRAIVTDKKLVKFLMALSQETDRAIVIIVATALEDRLRSIVRESLVDDGESDAFLRRNIRDLESLSRAAFCLGLISKREFRLIDRIRALRNSFAHVFFTDEFDGTLESKKGETFGMLFDFLSGYNASSITSSRKAFEAIAVHIVTVVWERSAEISNSDRVAVERE